MQYNVLVSTTTKKNVLGITPCRKFIQFRLFWGWQQIPVEVLQMVSPKVFFYFSAGAWSYFYSQNDGTELFMFVMR